MVNTNNIPWDERHPILSAVGAGAVLVGVWLLVILI